MSMSFDPVGAVTLEGRLYKPPEISIGRSLQFPWDISIKFLLTNLLQDTALESKVSEIYLEFSEKLDKAKISEIHNLSGTYYPRDEALTVVVNQRMLPIYTHYMQYKRKDDPPPTATVRTPLLARRSWFSR